MATKKIDVVNAIINDLQLAIDRAESLIADIGGDWTDIKMEELKILKGFSNEIDKSTYDMESELEYFY